MKMKKKFMELTTKKHALAAIMERYVGFKKYHLEELAKLEELCYNTEDKRFQELQVFYYTGAIACVKSILEMEE
jgi:hypothetical protein